jgi:hypothetical protein
LPHSSKIVFHARLHQMGVFCSFKICDTTRCSQQNPFLATTPHLPLERQDRRFPPCGQRLGSKGLTCDTTERDLAQQVPVSISRPGNGDRWSRCAPLLFVWR